MYDYIPFILALLLAFAGTFMSFAPAEKVINRNKHNSDESFKKSVINARKASVYIWIGCMTSVIAGIINLTCLK